MRQRTKLQKNKAAHIICDGAQHSKSALVIEGLRMQYYLLIYHVVEDYVTRRIPFREEHLRLAREAHSRGQLDFGGALADPVDKALLVFRCEDPGPSMRLSALIHMCKTAWFCSGKFVPGPL